MSIKKTDKTFLDITGQRLSNTSRLTAYNIFRITETNQYFLNHFKYFDISDEIKYGNGYFDIYIALEDDWWDNISHLSYGTPKYWFLICVMNDVINPYEELEPGQSIKILKQSYFYNIFKEFRNIATL